ncbi:hypothetical protein [Streptomyces sp. NPDC001843]|uniref:hypothetical protein n=1 Tax=Streptomyces sp. NPDC001843 TaxID=3364617 RepID=UPI0036C2DBA5
MSEREYWANVAERPGMFVGEVTLARLESFLEGYGAHAQRHGGPGFDGWHEWLVARRGRKCNHNWMGQVRHIALPNERWHFTRLSPEQENASSRHFSCCSMTSSRNEKGQPARPESFSRPQAAP